MRSGKIILTVFMAILTVSLSSLPNLSAQSTQKRRYRNPARINYAQRVEQAKDLFKWGKLYLKSFQKTHQYNYFKLSVNHSVDAIRAYYQIESQLAKTTKYYYLTKKRRMEICEFYEKLQKISHKFEEERHLPDIEGSLCVR